MGFWSLRQGGAASVGCRQIYTGFRGGIGQAIVAEIHFHKIVLASCMNKLHAERTMVVGFTQKISYRRNVYIQLIHRDELTE